MKTFVIFAVIGFAVLFAASSKVLIECWLDSVFDGLFNDFEITLP